MIGLFLKFKSKNFLALNVCLDDPIEISSALKIFYKKLALDSPGIEMFELFHERVVKKYVILERVELTQNTIIGYINERRVCFNNKRTIIIDVEKNNSSSNVFIGNRNSLSRNPCNTGGYIDPMLYSTLQAVSDQFQPNQHFN